MFIRTLAKALDEDIKKYIPDYNLLVDAVFKDDVYHNDSGGCVKGEKLTLSLTEVVAKAEAGQVCLDCGSMMKTDGYNLSDVWDYLQEFRALRDLCNNEIAVDRILSTFETLEKYEKSGRSTTYEDVPFPQELDAWSMDVVMQARARIDQLRKDIPSVRAKEIISHVFKKVFHAPQAWEILPETFKAKAEELFEEARVQVVDDSTSFMLSRELFSDSNLGNHPFADSYRGIDSRGLLSEERSLIDLLASLSPSPYQGLHVVPAGAKFIALSRTDPGLHQELSAQLEPSDTNSTLQAAGRLQADGGIYSSLTEALKAARSLA